MTRYCFTSRVDPRHLEQYRARHAAVWPEMLTALRDSGWRNYVTEVFHLNDQLRAAGLATDDEIEEDR